ncbi:MAG: single-stranded DNA-binding protein [Candidatus Improbicoccus devescovinae]|nr:MAG: single-stranded DNA-binding protein [Candidatus Improbicoccus devescovinae]
MLNSIVLMGRLTADPELKKPQNDKYFVKFNIAVNRYSKDKEHSGANFFKVVAWEKTAEFICNYFAKGDPIVVEGNVKTGSFTDDEGVKKKTFEVWVRQVNFSVSKKIDGNSETDQSSGSLANRTYLKQGTKAIDDELLF